MYIKHNYVFIFCLVLIVTGCAAQVKTSTPRSVIVENVSQYNSAEALHLAEEECMKYGGRHAVHVPDNIRDGDTSYECVE